LRCPARVLIAALGFLATAIGQDAATLNQSGASALGRGDFGLAIEEFQRAAKADPSNQQIQFNLALAYVRSGRPEDAIGPLRDAASDPALATEAHYLLGAAYFQSGQYAKVAEQLNGLDQGPHAEHVLFMEEESARLTSSAAKARQAFHELNQRFPDSAWLHFLMGAAYENQSDPERAIAEYKSSLARDPRLPNASFAIGYIYWKDRSFEESKPWLAKELETQPCHTLAAYYLGDAMQASGEKEEALKFYRRSIECNGRNQKAHLGLGILLANLNRDDEALNELQTAARLDDHDTSPHYRLALLYKKLGRKSESAAEYARVQQIHDAERKQAQENLQGKP
jgi:tetratricopeptide (TPR) repeat protein